MSKSNLRNKISVDSTKCNTDSRRPSVFERLGTKPVSTTSNQSSLSSSTIAVPATTTVTSSSTTTTTTTTSTSAVASDYCRNWALNGNCSYGKTCKYASTHTLISPSKRVKKDSNPSTLASKEDLFKRLTSKIVKKTSHSPDLNLEDWNQTDLEYEDEKVLERRRQLLQRELEIQMKKDKEVHGKDKAKHKKKVMTSSSSSRSSSTSSSSTSSTSDDSSSSSTSDSHKKVKKIKSKQRHHSVSSDYDDEKDRKRKLKLKRLAASKTEKLPVKKKRRVETPTKKDVAVKTVKKTSVSVTKKHAVVTRTRSPAPVVSSSKIRDRNRSESPKGRVRHCETSDRHGKKGRESADSPKDPPKLKVIDKIKEIDKSKSRLHEEKSKLDDKSRMRLKEKEIRSRTPPLDRLKHHPLPQKDSPVKSRRSRTPEKPRSKRDTPPRHEKTIISKRDIDRKDREVHKFDKNKDREDSRKNDINKSRSSSSQDDNQRKHLSRDMEERGHLNDKARQRSRERRDKEHISRDERHPRITKSDHREKERDEPLERSRERQREREREKNPKLREREMPVPSSSLSNLDKNPRYAREKERLKDTKEDKSIRDRRPERDREIRGSEKVSERDRSCQRYDNKYDRLDKEIHKPIERERLERYPRDRSLERTEKTVPSSSRDHLEREAVYDRGTRHRRLNTRYERSQTSVERKEIPPKIERLPERRESPRRSLEVERNFDRSYTRVSTDHWEHEEPPRIDYHQEEERRKPIEPRRYSSPFNERRPERNSTRFSVSGDRSYDEHHPIYPGDKLRPVRDEANNEKWDVHHEVEHGNRERVYPEWEEREWRPRGLWERENIPRSEAHEEEWNPQRYGSPITEWKVNDPRKWENPQLHLNRFRNERHKEEAKIPEVHPKRRPPEIRPFTTPEIRDEAAVIVPKPNILHGNMKEEPINKKLMQLAEGRLRRSREKSTDIQKKIVIPKEKPPELPKETKEPVVEVKKAVLDESSQHESDLSDISDDPDDILNMDDELEKKLMKEEPKPVVEYQETPITEQTVAEEVAPAPLKEKLKEEPESIDEENIEAMDFEEISDGELEEDIKTSGKGLGDALGVDWESLVKESQPKLRANPDSAKNRWQCKAIFQRIGISVKYAGNEFVDKINKKYADADGKFLLNDIAMIHTALFREKASNDSINLLDDHLYKVHSDVDRYESEDEDPQVLKPATDLLEEAKMFLQQSSIQLIR